MRHFELAELGAAIGTGTEAGVATGVGVETEVEIVGRLEQAWADGKVGRKKDKQWVAKMEVGTA